METLCETSGFLKLFALPEASVAALGPGARSNKGLAHGPGVGLEAAFCLLFKRKTFFDLTFLSNFTDQ